MKALRDKGVHPLDTLEKRTRLCKYDDRHPRISKRKYLYLPKMYDRSYWNWDPKETWAFITWIIFSIYLHTRTNPNFQGANSAIVASIGFLIIWICYFGVNLLGIGLHSYGSFPLTSS